jgi:tRNA G18 (ribose-2'-O)-methylase SpoU
MTLVRVLHADDPRLASYRNVSDGELLRRHNLFVAEGRLVVGRLFESEHRVLSVLVNEASRRSLEAALARLPDAVPVYVCETDDFASITGFNLHRGCLALAERPADRAPAAVMDGCDRLLILEGVADADNVGSALRNAAAFGARVLLSPGCCDPLYRKSIRTSMGAALRTPYARLENWPADLATVKSSGFTIAALTPRAHAADITSCPRLEKLALLVGSEGPGLTAAAEQFADACLRISTSGDVDSLNLATATGIALHHFSTSR